MSADFQDTDGVVDLSKNQNLKANHNRRTWICNWYTGVVDLSKNQNLKANHNCKLEGIGCV